MLEDNYVILQICYAKLLSDAHQVFLYRCYLNMMFQNLLIHSFFGALESFLAT